MPFFSKQKPGFIKIQRQVEDLLDNDPDAYLLMSQIMFRARRRTNKFCKNKLELNQALIGDYASIGLSQQRYRDAKERISDTYMLATFKGTNKGTIATILNLEFCDINTEDENEQRNEQRTNKERTENEQGTTNKEHKETKNERSKEQQPPKPPKILIPEEFSKSSIETKKVVVDDGFVFFDSFLKMTGFPKEKQEKWILSDENKQSLLRKYSQKRISLAFEYASSPGVPINTTLIQLLMWHCKQRMPTLTPEQIKHRNEDYEIENRKIAKEFHDQCREFLNEKNYKWNNETNSLRIENERTHKEISLKEQPHIFKNIVETTLRDYQLWIPKNDKIEMLPLDWKAVKN